MGHSSLGGVYRHRLHTQRLGHHKRLLSHVGHTQVLDQLQHSRSSILASQSVNNRAWTDIWHTGLVAVFYRSHDQHDFDLGVK